MEQAIADALTDDDGIALAVATSRLLFQQTNPLVARVRKNHHVTRSGDIYIVQEPYWFLYFDIDFIIFDMAAKRHKKHKNKISGLLISMGYKS